MKLRIKGHSYNEIRDKLGIPKSTLRTWFADLVLSNDARARLNSRIKAGGLALIRRNKMQTHHARQRAEQIKQKAEREIPAIDKSMLQVIGAVLYWAEGYKRVKIRDGRALTSHVISFVNSDPDMVRTFVRFAKEILDVPAERMCVFMRLYDHINEKDARKYWREVTGLPESAFRKTTNMVSIASQRKRPFNRLPFGTVQIQIAQTEKFYQIMGWIEGVKNQLKHGTLGERLGSSVVERPPESSGLSAETRIAKRVNSGDTGPEARQSRAKPGLCGREGVETIRKE